MDLAELERSPAFNGCIERASDSYGEIASTSTTPTDTQQESAANADQCKRGRFAYGDRVGLDAPDAIEILFGDVQVVVKRIETEARGLAESGGEDRVRSVGRHTDDPAIGFAAIFRNVQKTIRPESYVIGAG